MDLEDTCQHEHIDIDTLLMENKWDDLSLQYISDEFTYRHIDKLNWLIIAINWNIDHLLYAKFESRLLPYRYILDIRERCGFISLK
jgi:hypothetical protein